MKPLSFILSLLITTAASATILRINNWCNHDIWIWKWDPLQRCDVGNRNACSSNPNELPIGIQPGASSSGGSSMDFEIKPTSADEWKNWIEATIRIKIYKEKPKNKNYMEFRYALQHSEKGDGILQWSLSDEKGAFMKEFVKVTPYPERFLGGDCLVIRCRKNQEWCNHDQRRAAERFRACNHQPDIMWLDICEPEHLWNNRRGEELLEDMH
ncbi:hypothetical protein BKA65DRAFT_480519 [Rhexocercosporidium sp. MPI-PUGE-AT-0058]|nr:hypothetical protein BKA65DRAFT_480519 [Rhexocercosporidium sp. MPI-PUGE-AT-0058]